MIDSFENEYRFLSNFFKSQIKYEDIEYSTVEHAFQAAKTLDIDTRNCIARLLTPAEAKYAGRFVCLRPDWDKIKIDIMHELVHQKFTKHFALRVRLLATGDRELIEGNRWNDRFWGVCRGKGENHLGKILMKVRKELRNV